MIQTKAGVKISNYIVTVIEILVLISAVISTGICIYHRWDEFLWLLPLAFFGCFWFVIYKWDYIADNLLIVLMVGVLYIRDVVIPILFYCMNVDPWYLGYNANRFHELSNIPQTLSMMLLELFAIFGIIKLFGKKYTLQKTAEYNAELGRGVIGIVIVIGMLIIINEPYYLGIYDMLRQFYEYEAASFKVILVAVTTLLLAIAFLVMIKRAKKLPEPIKLCLTGAVWMVFCLEESLGGNPNHPISRWGFILNLIIGGIMVLWLYPNYRKVVLSGLAIIAVAGIGALSVLRGFNVSKFFCYTNFNDYFAGPTNISFIVDMCQSDEYNITFRTFWGDVFANVPIVNHFFDGKDNTLYYFCPTVFGMTQAEFDGYYPYDSIVPFTGQMYTYFSYVGVVVGNALMAYLAIVVNYWAKKADNLFLSYGLLYMAVVFSLATIFSLNIIFQYLSISIFPVLFVVIVDVIFGKVIDKVSKERKKS